jgi:ferrous iron transport protein A
MTTEHETCPLSRLRSGESATVLSMHGGRGFQHRVMSMGMAIGGEVEVIRGRGGNGKGGPVVVRCGDTRLMLGHGMSEKIIVRRPSPAKK